MKQVRHLFSYTIVTAVLLLLAAAAQAQNGRVTGKIVDKKTGEELIGVAVQIEGTTIGAATDFEGKYNLSAAPGTYNLVFSYVSYNKKILKGVEIKSKEVTTINVSMEEATTQLNEVVIQTEAKKETASALLIQQKNAVSVSSGVSSDLIRRTPDRTTADVIKRISGASVQDNKFAIVRGLSDRYNMGYLNGAPLPSTESDRKAFSLDVIPASVIDNMAIVKTASPDMPGDFAGGIIQINTKDIPEENSINANLGLQYHSLTTFQSGLRGATSSTDWLGYDNGTRQLPTNLLSTEQNHNASLQQLSDETKGFNNNFQPSAVSAYRPNLSFQLSASKRAKIFNNDFGVVFALSYNNSFRYTPFSTNSLVIGNEQKSADANTSDGTINNFDKYQNNVVAGSVLNFAYKVGNHSKFTFKNLLTSTSEDQTLHQTGTVYELQRERQTRYDNYIYYYQSGRMYSSQLTGEHVLSKQKIKVKYTGSYNNIHREVPDYRRILYTSQMNRVQGDTAFGPNQVALVPNASSYTPVGSGRYFSQLDEKMYSVRYDVAVPFKVKFLDKSEVKVGGFNQWRDRQFAGRNFMYTQNDNNYDPSKGDPIKLLGPGEVFANANISPSTHYLAETTQGSDSYNASSKLDAAYAMLDFKVFKRLRVTGGARLERFNQKISSTSLGTKQEVDTTYTDILPSVNLIYELSDKVNLRASASKTLSRPEFREFAQLAFYEINYNAIIVGNPGLIRTEIYNYDFKLEYYPTAGQVLSINPFYKKFINPVEISADPGPSGINGFSYINAPKANNYGVELEARISLSSVRALSQKEFLKNLTVFANYAYIFSSVSLNDTSTNANEVSRRSLQGQSPYVFNAGIIYSDPKRNVDVSLTCNQVGRRIAFVNQSKNFLIWENPRTVIDASISKTFNKKLVTKITFGDLLAQALVYYQDLNDNGKYDEGSDVTTFKYKYGRTVQLSVGYTF